VLFCFGLAPLLAANQPSFFGASAVVKTMADKMAGQERRKIRKNSNYIYRLNLGTGRRLGCYQIYK